MHVNSCRRATHWLFSRLIGASEVVIPETALFDDEGVLTAWLYTPEALESQRKNKKPKSFITNTFSVRSRTELNLVQFEARLQDLVRRSPGAAVAASFDGEPPVVLDEYELDAKIRGLCVRERTLTAPEPNLVVTRQYPGGRFLIQALVGISGANQSATLHTTTTRYRTTDGGESFSHQLKCTPAKNEDSVHSDDPGADLSVTFVSAESQCRAIAAHLKSAHGCIVYDMTLEFSFVCDRLSSNTVLTRAHEVKWTARESTNQGEVARCSPPPTQLKTGCKHAYRICRQCRAPIEVDLARELVQQRTITRDVLARYQTLSEGKVDAEVRLKDALDGIAHREAQMMGLEFEITRLMEQLSAATMLTEQLRLENRKIDVELTEAKKQALEAHQEVTLAREEIHRLELHQAEVTVLSQRQEESRIREIEASNAVLKGQVRELRCDIENVLLMNTALRSELEEARASWDEMSLQWSYVARKLTDVGEKGVFPPKRVAGGFSSYPTPSEQNVEHVVKWIVDSEAKRAIFDAQQLSGQTHQPHSAKRRLRVKIELMRLLASSSGPPSSPSRRRTSRRKSSKSPRKRTSPTPRRQEARLPVTLVSERFIDAQLMGECPAH